MFKLVPIRQIRPIRKMQNPASSEAIFEQFFDNFFNDDMFTSYNKIDRHMTGFMVDVIDEGDKYMIEAELPGFEKDDVKVEYRDQHLTIRAKRDDVDEERKNNYIRRERNCGEFTRSFYVDNIHPDKITASFDKGILRVTLEKEPLKNDSREIAID